MLYVVTGPNAVASYGGITLSRCRYYPVDRGAAVIGPVETTADCRGKGLATWGLIMAMEQLTRTGRRTFYIDTSEGNVAMQTVIARCGFGDPIACYERDERMYR
jgi:RimJ/RimL family protein N-acetyltransferase